MTASPLTIVTSAPPANSPLMELECIYGIADTGAELVAMTPCGEIQRYSYKDRDFAARWLCIHSEGIPIHGEPRTACPICQVLTAANARGLRFKVDLEARRAWCKSPSGKTYRIDLSEDRNPSCSCPSHAARSFRAGLGCCRHVAALTALVEAYAARAADREAQS